MVISTPVDAVNLYNNERASFLKLSRKEDRQLAIKHFNDDIDEDAIREAVDWIKENFSIDLSPEQFIEISNLYPFQRKEILEELHEEAVGSMICHFFADSKMITYGDTKEDDKLKDEFYKMIKDLAKEFGYKVV